MSLSKAEAMNRYEEQKGRSAPRVGTPQNSQSHAVDAGVNDEEAGSKHAPDRRNAVKDQGRGKGVRAKFFSGHVGQDTNVHVQITNDKPSIQEGKEAPGQQ
jgi:hypothetical protein